MNKTQIEWVKNPDGTQGYTWNPITGCLNGCEYCYARRLANTRLRERYLANKNVAPLQPNWFHTFSDGYVDSRYDAPFYPRFWEDRLEPIGLTGGNKRPHSYGYLGGFKEHKPKGIFVCDMSDLFGIGLPQEWTNRVFDTIKKCPEHRFYLLTKQSQNLIKFSPFSDNCWVGVTATDNEMYYEALRVLADRDYWYNRPRNSVEAKVRYLSFEPLLGRINLDTKHGFPLDLAKTGISWVIIGAQTKPYIPPEIEWVREIVEACDKAGIPVFLKNNLYYLVTHSPLGQCNGLYQEGFKLRQELPQ